MAKKIGAYTFKNVNDYKKAREALFYQMGKDYANPECLEFCGWYDEGEYRINYYEGVSNVDKLSDIMALCSAKHIPEM